ncbi:MAG: hypothetical protein EBU97_00145 [Rhodobacteraceae bacterium]|nr:hypothetical protein [Paracoccaceae bacterium]
MRQIALLLPLLFAAGCSLVPVAPQPVDARLSQTTLTVALSDGTLCRTPWAAGAGRLDQCGPGFDWRVTVVERPNLLRRLWVDGMRALGAEGAVPPMAQVVLTGDDGQSHSFTSPPPVN